MKFDFTETVRQKTNQELMEIFIHPKDYNPDLVALAELELTKRNINLDKSKQVRQTISHVELRQLEKGKKGSPLFIFFCFILALAGGLLGIYAGYVYSQSKIRTDDNKEYFAYDEETRRLGRLMMLLGGGVIIVLLLKQSFAV
ncbi:hypothetical protein QTN47_13590 [Danxiaibacter flavus]|uniref:Uncharacterized protein n=1 Tax=Danxiaibacter flavus TaxID=3049108 RepID=A0ABV3ZG88_9BACT|nr:hypothetical protein QNM32_13595 [Chitinophagaceae bacterium DXS]